MEGPRDCSARTTGPADADDGPHPIDARAATGNAEAAVGEAGGAGEGVSGDASGGAWLDQ